MNDQTVIPVARPSPPAIVPAADPHSQPTTALLTAPPTTLSAAPLPPPPVYAPYAPYGYAMQPVRPKTDSLAVASAVCGFTGIIPIVCQIAGLTLGILSLLRIRRSKIVGMPLRGTPWAIVGLVTSGVGLLGWIGMFAGLSMLGSSLGSSSDLLQSLIPQ